MSDKTFSYAIDNLKPSTTYFIRSYMVNGKCLYYGNVKEFSTKEFKVEAVDLGLSVKWANCNVGATSPEDYGDYFAWGETSPKSNYDWDTYKWCNGSRYTITKYCSSSESTHWGGTGAPDNKTTLELADDAAHVIWGGSWRMPTYYEISELVDNCIWKWTTRGGVDGCKVISKANGNSIFLPASGYFNGATFYSGAWSGGYWSSTRNSATYARLLIFYSSYVSPQGSSYRYCGRTVRGVCQ